MSPRLADDVVGSTGQVRRVGITGLVLLVVVLGLALLIRASPATLPFDPNSSRGDGARALVLLLEGRGAHVDVSRSVPPVAADRRVLVLADRLDDAQRAAVLSFAEQGGVLVVADPASSLQGGPGTDGGSRTVHDAAYDSRDRTNPAPNLDPGTCTIDALGALRGLYVPDGLQYPVAPDEPQCFGDGRVAFVIRHGVPGKTAGAPRTVIGLGDNHVFTNDLIGRADNSGLATALLAPVSGTSVTILVGNGRSRSVGGVGSGDQTLGDLVRPGVWMALVELAVAFVVFAVARGVRPGRTLDEAIPAPLEGSELVRATGALARRAGHHDRAGWMLRTELRRDLCHRYRLDPATSAVIVAGHARDRDGIDAALVEQALDAQVSDDVSLIGLAFDVDQIRSALEARTRIDPGAIDTSAIDPAFAGDPT
jgi:Domain of unknown function (DUF4350)